MNKYSDDNLIKEYLEGNSEAFKILFNRYKQHLYNFILSMTGNKELSEDIFQEVFIKIIDNIKRYEYNNFKAYLFTVARNTVLDYIKSSNYRNNKKLLSVDTESFPAIKDLSYSEEDKIIMNEKTERLYKAIYSLSYEYQEIIFLKHFSGMTFNEISKILKIPTGTLLSRFKRAIDKLNKILSSNMQ
jgi:RNA polymerase sigma-70 factor (ECF subfamily)